MHRVAQPATTRAAATRDGTTVISARHTALSANAGSSQAATIASWRGSSRSDTSPPSTTLAARTAAARTSTRRKPLTGAARVIS
jgi:hypothetical protein